MADIVTADIKITICSNKRYFSHRLSSLWEIIHLLHGRWFLVQFILLSQTPCTSQIRKLIFDHIFIFWRLSQLYLHPFYRFVCLENQPLGHVLLLQSLQAWHDLANAPAVDAYIPIGLKMSPSGKEMNTIKVKHWEKHN